MIFLLHGSNSFLSYRQLADTKRRFLEKHPDGYNLCVFDDPESASAKKMADFLQTGSLFSSPVKLGIIKNFSEIIPAAEKEKIINLFKTRGIKTDKKSHIVILETKAISKNPIYAKIKEISSEKIFSDFTPYQTEKWIISEFKEKEISASSAAAKKIIAIAGKDLWNLDREIDKLASWLAFQEKQNLSDIDSCLEVMLDKKIENNIFEAIEAIAGKDQSKAISLAWNAMEEPGGDLYLLSMMAYQFKTMLKVKSLSGDSAVPINILAKDLKMHPYPLKKALMLSARFSMKELKSIYGKILECENSIKRGRNGKEMVVDLVVKLSKVHKVKS